MGKSAVAEKAVVKVCPSILASDFSKLGDEARRAEDSGADCLHVDVMDGHFVRNITIGPKVVAAINRSTSLFLDVHLMIYNPFDFIEAFVEAGADMLTIHFEATEDVEDTLAFIRRCNIKAGLAFSPETSESMVLRYLDKCDMILLMTVNPGFGGQPFIPEVLDKIRFTREMCNKLGIRQGGVSVGEDSSPEEKALPPYDIQVDGGINNETGRQCVEAGANVLVAGTHLYAAKDMAAAIQEMRQATMVQ